MRLVINGEDGTLPDGCTVMDMLRERGHDPAAVVVELNGGIVPAASFAGTGLSEGDRVEIVQFVGGG